MGWTPFKSSSKAHARPEIVEADVGEETFRSLTPKNTMCDHYTARVLTPLLIPLRVLHAETLGNHQQINRLR